MPKESPPITVLGACCLAAGMVIALLAIVFPTWYARIPTARNAGDIYIYLGRAPLTKPPEKTDRRIPDFTRSMAPRALWPDPTRATIVIDWQTLASDLAAIVLIFGGAFAASNHFLRDRNRYHNQSRGLCPNCGYDWRATPNRCPECGTIPTP